MQKFCVCGFLFAAVFLLAQTNVAEGNGKVLCYYSSWAYSRPGEGRYLPSDIDPLLCTHVLYAYFGIDNQSRIASIDPDFDKPGQSDGGIGQTVALKEKNEKLKVLASVGGWVEGPARFSAAAATAENRTIFVNSVVELLLANNFDGLDIDWEYPNQREGSKPEDKANFVTLLKELNPALKKHGLLLTIAVEADAFSTEVSYDVPGIAANCDLVNVMTHDYVSPDDGKTGFDAPLKGPPADYNVEYHVKNYLAKGVPRNKLIMGIPLFGRSFTLADSKKNKPGDLTTGGGAEGPYTEEVGYLSYNEVCEFLQQGWKKRWNELHEVPYAWKGDQWVSYDDARSIRRKVEFIKKERLAGAFVWSIDSDDFRGTCGEKYILMRTINKGLENKIPRSS